MSNLDIKAFQAKVAETPQWQEKLNSSQSEEDFIQNYLKLAQEHQYQVTEKDIRTFIEKAHTVLGKKEELSVEELSNVAGGKEWRNLMLYGL